MRYTLSLLLLGCSVFAQHLPRRNFFGAAVDADPRGVRVTAVLPDSPAASAGLRINDVIATIGTQKIATREDFLQVVRSAPASAPFSVFIVRGDQTEHLTVDIVPVAEESDPKTRTMYSAIQVGASLRRTLITIPRQAAGRLPAVLLRGGIGCYSVDNPADPNDPYRFLAHDLSPLRADCHAHREVRNRRQPGQTML